MAAYKNFDDALTTIEFQNVESILDIFGEVGLLDPSDSVEPIDDDEDIEAILAASNL